jgi:hypothetical protein
LLSLGFHRHRRWLFPPEKTVESLERWEERTIEERERCVKNEVWTGLMPYIRCWTGPVCFWLGPLASPPLDLGQVSLDQSCVPQDSWWSRIHLCVGLGLKPVFSCVLVFVFAISILLFDNHTPKHAQNVLENLRKIHGIFSVFLWYSCVVFLHWKGWIKCIDIFRVISWISY